MKTLPLVLVCALGATTASAQTAYHFGVRVGGNYATTTEKSPTQTFTGNGASSYSKSPIFAYQLGMVLEARKGNFAFQPALVFSQKGTIIKAEVAATDLNTGYLQQRKGQTTVRYNWLELPLNLVYNLPGKSGLQVFAGPYVAVGVGGKAVTEINNSTNDPDNPVVVPFTKFTDKVEYDPSDATLAKTSSLASLSIRGFYSRRVDAGFNAGLGYQRGPVQVQAGYGLGLVNLFYNKDAGIYTSQSGYNRSAQLTLTYFL